MTAGRAALVLATAAALALAARSIVRDPPPVPVALGALAAYAALIVAGVVVSRWEMFARVLSRGPRAARGVALTFDDGPDPRTTPRVLRMLQRAHATAAFFVVGHKAEAHPELISDIVAHGHVLGVHGYRHHRLLALRSARFVRADLERTMRVLEDITGERPRLLRPPIGPVSPSLARAASELGLQIVGWSVKGLDGLASTNPERVLDRIVPKLRDRAIVLLHDASERGDFEPASLRALPEILRVAEIRGLEWVRVDRWLDPDSPSADAAASDPASATNASDL